MKIKIKILRVVAIISLGLTAAMNILGGAGTYCAAFSDNVGYRMAFKDLMDYRWIYQILVVTTILVGIAGVIAVIKLVRSKPGVYRFTLIVLIIGVLLGATHFFSSLTLRGEATPANVKFFINLFTLLVFLTFQLPGIKDEVDFSQPSDQAEKRSAAGIASIIMGLTTLTIFAWAGPSHTYFGENWVFVFETPLLIAGTLMILGGFYVVYKEAVTLYLAQSDAQQDVAPKNK